MTKNNRNSVNKSQKIGIMGGTFDPIHYGHLVTAEAARHQFELDRVIFIPAGKPPHKNRPNISEPEHRLVMTSLAVQSNPCFEVSDMEITRTGPSYTINTVTEIMLLYSGADVFFITGADAVLEILTWHRVYELLNICCFIAATRPGYCLNSLREILASLPERYLDNIYTMEVPALAISSTDIRLRIKGGRPIKYLLPEAVEEYILKHDLYC